MKNSGSILLVANYEPNVGYAWWLMENYWRVIAELAQREQRPCILAYPVLDGAVPKLGSAPATLAQLDFSDTSLRGYLALLRLVRRFRVRSVYLTDQPYFDLRYALMRLCGVRRIVLHDHQPGDRDRVSIWKGALKRLIHLVRLFSCTQYVAVSAFVRERMIASAKVLPEKCVVVRNGIALAPSQVRGDEASIREEFGIASSAVVVALVSRAHPYKRIDFAVRCAAEIERRNPQSKLHFLFCGDGPALPELRQLVDQLGVPRRFTLAGKRSDVRRILSECDVGMHPSRGEVGFCLAILECMAAGLPVLVPNIDSVRGATDHGNTGFVYEDESIESVLNYLFMLERDPDLRRRIGAAAQQVVHKEFDLEHTNAEFSRLVASRL